MSVIYQCFGFTYFIINGVIGVRNIANEGYNWGPNYGNSNYQYGVPGYCPAGSQCIHIDQCPFLYKVINNACVYTNRIGELGCGYQGTGHVCCPVENNSPRSNPNGQFCGRSLVEPGPYNKMGAYPWVVRVMFKDAGNGELKFPCSGSILNNRVVLTAAHCALTKSDNYKLYGVRVGEWSTNSDIDCGHEFCSLPLQDITMSHVIVHPGYDQHTFKDNIALLVLGSRINYSVTAQPICLPQNWATTSNYGLLVGWGKIAGQHEAASYQQVLQMPIVGLQQCANIYGRTLPISENNLCVGGLAGRDACNGFGGSPLVDEQGGTYYQIGILSFGSDQCGAPGVPSVYTNVKRYVNWIKDNIPTFRN